MNVPKLEWQLNLDIHTATCKLLHKYTFFKIRQKFNFFYELEISDNTGIIHSDSFETVEAAKAASEVFIKKVCALVG